MELEELALLENRKKDIRRFISDILKDDSEKDSVVIEACKYMSLNDSSGLYRPLLLMATAEDYSVPVRKSLRIGTAIELVHVESLIADDIMDNSEIRRGRPSCHVKYGPNIAILVQDYLREIAQEVIENTRISHQQRNDINRMASGTGKKMVYGQEKDVLQRDLDTPEKVIRMYEQKSGALIGAALACAGILGNASKMDIDNLESIGVAAGVSYQIIDDVRDVKGTFEEMGKPVNQDSKKQTLLKLVGLDGVKRLKQEKDGQVDDLMDRLQGNASNLRNLIMYLRSKRDAIL